MDVILALEKLAPKTLLLSRKIEYKNLPVLPVNLDKFQIAPYGRTMVAATMKISEYVVVIYNFQTGIANRSILVKKHCFIA